MASRVQSRQAQRADARRAERRALERERRHEERLRRADRSRRASRRRRVIRVAATRLAVAVVALSAAVVWSGADEPTHQPRLADPVPIHSYRVTYSVTYSGGVHNVETVTVQRPGNGIDQTVRDGQVVAGQMSNPDGLWTWSTNNPPGWVLLSQGRQRPTSDAQPVWALNQGVARRAVQVVGTDVVAGRTCTVVITGQPAGQPVQPPDASSRTRLCIDRTGVPLSQVWTLDGKLAETMTATSFEPNFTVTPSTFDAQPRPPGPAPRVAVLAAPLSEQSRAQLTPKLDPLPPGYSRLDGYISIERDGQTGLPSFTTKELYVQPRTGEELELDYLGSPGGRQGIPEPVAGGRVGYLALDLYACTLTVPVNDGASLVMYSPDPSVLLQAASRLRF